MNNQFLLKFITNNQQNNKNLNQADSKTGTDINSNKSVPKRELINLDQATNMTKNKQKGKFNFENYNHLDRNIPCNLYKKSESSNSLPISKMYRNQDNSSKLFEQNALLIKGNRKENFKIDKLKKETVLDKKYQEDIIIGSRKRHNEHLNKLLISKSKSQKQPGTEINKDNISLIEIDQSQQMQKKLLEQASFQFEITGNFYSNYNQTYFKENEASNYPEKLEEDREDYYSPYTHVFPEERKLDPNRNLINYNLLNSSRMIKLKNFDLASNSKKGFISNKYKALVTNNIIEN